jgi:hypothetical protein
LLTGLRAGGLQLPHRVVRILAGRVEQLLPVRAEHTIFTLGAGNGEADGGADREGHGAEGEGVLLEGAFELLFRIMIPLAALVGSVVVALTRALGEMRGLVRSAVGEIGRRALHRVDRLARRRLHGIDRAARGVAHLIEEVARGVACVVRCVGDRGLRAVDETAGRIAGLRERVADLAGEAAVVVAGTGTVTVVFVGATVGIEVVAAAILVADLAVLHAALIPSAAAIQEQPRETDPHHRSGDGVALHGVHHRIAGLDHRLACLSCHGVRLSNRCVVEGLLGLGECFQNLFFDGLFGLTKLCFDLRLGLGDLVFDSFLDFFLHDVQLLDGLLAKVGRVQPLFDRRERLRHVGTGLGDALRESLGRSVGHLILGGQRRARVLLGGTAVRSRALLGLFGHGSCSFTHAALAFMVVTVFSGVR